LRRCAVPWWRMSNLLGNAAEGFHTEGSRWIASSRQTSTDCNNTSVLRECLRRKRVVIKQREKRGATMGLRSYQQRVADWVCACFPPSSVFNRTERSHRFLEESLELAQASGCSEEDAIALVRYVYSRPVGEITQETGGVMVTLAALCNAQDVDLEISADR